jgi:hypothetical protein
MFLPSHSQTKKNVFFFSYEIFQLNLFLGSLLWWGPIVKKWDFSIVPPFLLTAPSFIPLGKFRNVQTISTTTFVIKITFVGL